jgi:crossover junction endodeoxyribonuclease RusA
MNESFLLVLPFPPSINRYWKQRRGRVVKSDEGRRYCTLAAWAARDARVGEPMEGEVRVLFSVFPPDRRKRDLDNLHKVLLDALEAGGVFRDDTQVAELETRRGASAKPGCVVVEVGALPRAPRTKAIVAAQEFLGVDLMNRGKR